MGSQGLAAYIFTIHEPALKVAALAALAVALVLSLLLFRMSAGRRVAAAVTGGVVFGVTIYVVATRAAGVHGFDVEVVRVSESSAP